eukprot:gene13147-biopygen20006
MILFWEGGFPHTPRASSSTQRAATRVPSACWEKRQMPRPFLQILSSGARPRPFLPLFEEEHVGRSRIVDTCLGEAATMLQPTPHPRC